MSASLAARCGKLSEDVFGAAVLSVAASRTVQKLGDAYHREIGRLIGSRSVGLYALKDGRPRLLFSRQAESGFLQEYDERTDHGDILVDRICERGRSVDGFTELGASAWHHTGSFDLLQRWGYRHCMGGPLCVDGRVIGVVYTANQGQTMPYGPSLLQRMDILCRAGSIALVNMMESGFLLDADKTPTVDVHPTFPPAETSSLLHLPRRSREVAELVSRGQSNKEIARALGLSVHTVKEYVGNLCKRLDVHNRTELARRFSELG
jgi:DNA-binding CsgD family transcriptional regulator